MMRRFNHTLLAIALSVMSAASFATPPKNIILIIADGMDDQQITIARNYLTGPAGQLGLDTMPVRSSVAVLTVDEADPSKPVFVADSANTASAIASGVVTSQGRISTTAKTNRITPTIMELAADAGLATGIVSTASITDATPAAFLSHSKYRGCESPNMMNAEASYYGLIKPRCDTDAKANGGPGSIAEQLVESSATVMLGGGLKHFDQVSDSDNTALLAKAKQRGFEVVTDRQAMLSASGNRLLGLFSASTMPVMWRGDNDRKAEFLKDNAVAFGCEPEPKHAGLPRLAEMTQVALDKLSKHDKGFILMTESASVDKQAHGRKPCGHIGEMLQLEETLQVALGFAEKHPGTLVLVTADHGHAAQIIPAQSLFEALGTDNHSGGRVALLKTPRNEVMAINYATNAGSVSEEHTGVHVPLFGNAAAEGLFPRHINQPDLFGVMKAYLGL
ncbi:MAG TPA: alkaline phosphatase [Pseudomonadales bacterium]|nr:alkaline phosphatase [Pseudomonadales bacterium]